MKICSFLSIFIVFFFMGLSSLVNSHSEPCNSNLNLKNLIPFNTTSLNCLAVWAAQGFILRFVQSEPNLWSFVLSAPNPNSYVAIGFSTNGEMVGSSAIAGWMPRNGSGVIKQYDLTAKNETKVVPDQGRLQVVNGSMVIVSQSSRLYLAFQLNISQPESKLLYSFGPSNAVPSANNFLSMHQDKISTQISYATVKTSSEDPYTSLSRTHGILNIVGWGILMPLGAMMARYFKNWGPAWYYSHAVIQTLGFGLGVVGVITGFSIEDDMEMNVDTHKGLGIFILALGCLQVLAFLARPDKASKVRRYWNWYHYSVGRVLIGIAMGNIFYGLALGEEEKSWFVAYGVAVGFWFVLCFCLEVKHWMKN